MSDTIKPGDPADRAADGAFGGVTSHRAGYGDRLARVEAWLRKHPSATLASGEGAVLLAEIDRLRDYVAHFKDELSAARVALSKKNAAIERVRAIHTQPYWPRCTCMTSTPCPTLRALDGGDA